MFIPAGEKNQAQGAIIFFEIESIRPAVLTISLEPAMVEEWPAPSFGRPSAYWRPLGSGGAFVLSTDNPEIFGMVGMPNATSGPLAPYQERPQALPLEFKLRFDPAKDQHHFFPLIAEVSRSGEKNSPSAIGALQNHLVATHTPPGTAQRRNRLSTKPLPHKLNITFPHHHLQLFSSKTAQKSHVKPPNLSKTRQPPHNKPNRVPPKLKFRYPQSAIIKTVEKNGSPAGTTNPSGANLLRKRNLPLTLLI
jgi:hypothetical protein